MRIFVVKDQMVSEALDFLHVTYMEEKEESIISVLEDYDVVFIQENMSLVQQIHNLGKKVNIIYISNSTKDCLEAYRVHVSGYITKPFTVTDIQEEMNHLRYGKWNRAMINCFGSFDVMLDGKSISFPRRKAKEILAYLVFRHGQLVSVDEISEVIFKEVTDKTRKYIYVLKFEAVKALTNHGLDDILRVEGNRFRFNPKSVECDFNRYLEGETELYQGEFMKQYPWAKTMLEEWLEKRVK